MTTQPPQEGSPLGPTPPAAPPAFGGGPHRRPRARFFVIGMVLAVALGVGLFTSLGSSSTTGRPGPGRPAPTFSLPRLGGGAAVGIPADGGSSGRPAVLLFYSSSCVPCRTEIPEVASLYRHQHDPGVALIGVAAADPNPKAFATASKVSFPVGLDSSLNVTEGSYYFTGLPEAVFVNGDGTIKSIHYGAVTPAELVAGERTLHS